MHKVGGVIVFSTDNIIISTMFGLTILGAYSNYYLIITSLMAVFTLLSSTLTGSVGNLVASENKEYVYKRYSQINFIFSVFSSFTTICMLCLFQPFINIWTGGGIYLLEFSTVLLICVSYYLNRMRSAVNIFKEGAGIFWQNRFMPIAESVVNLFVSIVLGMFMGIDGVILGTIISTIVAPLWVEPKVLYKHYFKKSVWDYFKTYIRDVLIMIGVGVICYFVCSFIPDGGIWWLIARFAVCGGVTGLLLIVAYLPTKDFKNSLAWFKDILKSRKKS